MKKTIILIIGIVCMAAVSTLVFAHGPGWGGASRGGGYYYDCPYTDYDGASLTQEQRMELDTLRQEYLTQTDKIRDRLRDKRYEMNTELNRENPDEQKIRGLQKEISELKGQMDSARIDHILKAKKVDPDIDTRSFGKNSRFQRACNYNRY